MKHFIRRMGMMAAAVVFVCGCDSGIDYSMIPSGSPSDSSSSTQETAPTEQITKKASWTELESAWTQLKSKVPNPFLTPEERQSLQGETQGPPPEPVTIVGGGLAAVFKSPSDEATFAVFNGRIVRPGDQVDDKKVLAIEEDEIRLVGPDQAIYIYRLKEPAS